MHSGYINRKGTTRQILQYTQTYKQLHSQHNMYVCVCVYLCVCGGGGGTQPFFFEGNLVFIHPLISNKIKMGFSTRSQHQGKNFIDLNWGKKKVACGLRSDDHNYYFRTNQKRKNLVHIPFFFFFFFFFFHPSLSSS